MNKIYVFVAAVILAYSVPLSGFAAGLKLYPARLLGIANGQIIFSTVSAAKYSAELSNAVLTRKNGASNAIFGNFDQAIKLRLPARFGRTTASAPLLLKIFRFTRTAAPLPEKLPPSTQPILVLLLKAKLTGVKPSTPTTLRRLAKTAPTPAFRICS